MCINIICPFNNSSRLSTYVTEPGWPARLAILVVKAADPLLPVSWKAAGAPAAAAASFPKSYWSPWFGGN